MPSLSSSFNPDPCLRPRAQSSLPIDETLCLRNACAWALEFEGEDYRRVEVDVMLDCDIRERAFVYSLNE